jgi:hypothetical protein
LDQALAPRLTNRQSVRLSVETAAADPTTLINAKRPSIVICRARSSTFTGCTFETHSLASLRQPAVDDRRFLMLGRSRLVQSLGRSAGTRSIESVREHFIRHRCLFLYFLAASALRSTSPPRRLDRRDMMLRSESLGRVCSFVKTSKAKLSGYFEMWYYLPHVRTRKVVRQPPVVLQLVTLIHQEYLDKHNPASFLYDSPARRRQTMDRQDVEQHGDPDSQHRSR